MLSRFSLFFAGVILISMSLVSKQTVDAAPPPTGNPQFDAALRKGLAYLRKEIGGKNVHVGEKAFAAYTLLKGGDPVNSAEIQAGIQAVKGQIKNGTYTPADPQHHIYESGVSTMLLADAGGAANFEDVQAITKYIIEKQQPGGFWDYPSPDVGDTSMAQYAVLGLWAAERLRVDIPTSVWDKAAAWHIRTQKPDGGWQYHPGKNVSNTTGGNNSTLNMTAGAAGTLAIIKNQLYPGARRKKARKTEDKKVFGVLEAKVDPVVAQEIKNDKAQTSLGAIDSSINRGMGWMAGRYKPINTDQPAFPFYFTYALERTCALNEVGDKLAGRIDWFQTTGTALVQTQEPTGGWGKGTDSGKIPSACFACLFYIRPTKATVLEQYGAGMLAGGRGLPDNLADASVSGGKIKARKIESPLDQLLTDLSKLNPDQLEQTQNAIVEKVQLGSREELLGEIDRIRKLITHSNVDIRRTAIWALGRSGDLKDANLLINALEDNNVDVLVEAYNALCYLSRKISGVGISPNPFDDLPVDPTQAQKEAAVARWRQEALKGWTAWYLRVRPYAEKNDLFQLRFRSFAEKR